MPMRNASALFVYVGVQCKNNFEAPYLNGVVFLLFVR